MQSSLPVSCPEDVRVRMDGGCGGEWTTDTRSSMSSLDDDAGEDAVVSSMVIGGINGRDGGAGAGGFLGTRIRGSPNETTLAGRKRSYKNRIGSLSVQMTKA